MRWKLPFGLVSVGMGLFLLYAAWAEPPFLYASTLCEVDPNPGVHFGADWTIEYYSSCGSEFDYALLYFLGFTIVALTLVGGGAATVRETVA